MPHTRTELSFNDKLKILDAVISQEKSGQRVNFTLIGKDFKVDRSIVSKISHFFICGKKKKKKTLNGPQASDRTSVRDSEREV